MDERLNQSTKAATSEIIDILKSDPEFKIFGQVLCAAEAGIKQRTLLGFFAVATFIQIEAEESPLNFEC